MAGHENDAVLDGCRVLPESWFLKSESSFNSVSAPSSLGMGPAQRSRTEGSKRSTFDPAQISHRPGFRREHLTIFYKREWEHGPRTRTKLVRLMLSSPSVHFVQGAAAPNASTTTTHHREKNAKNINLHPGPIPRHTPHLVGVILASLKGGPPTGVVGKIVVQFHGLTV